MFKLNNNTVQTITKVLASAMVVYLVYPQIIAPFVAQVQSFFAGIMHGGSRSTARPTRHA